MKQNAKALTSFLASLNLIAVSGFVSYLFFI